MAAAVVRLRGVSDVMRAAPAACGDARPPIRSGCRCGQTGSITRPGDSMPLSAVTCALAALLNVGFVSFVPSLLSDLIPQKADSTSQVVFEPTTTEGRIGAPVARWVAPHVDTVLWSSPRPDAEELAQLTSGRRSRSRAGRAVIACRCSTLRASCEVGSRRPMSGRSIRRCSVPRGCHRLVARSPGPGRPE